jgi:hypothetical protein
LEFSIFFGFIEGPWGYRLPVFFPLFGEIPLFAGDVIRPFVLSIVITAGF